MYHPRVPDTAVPTDVGHADRPFLADAWCNLVVVRQLYGPQGRRYRRLVRQYRYVGNALGCRRALERLLHPLPRRHLRAPHRHTWPPQMARLD